MVNAPSMPKESSEVEAEARRRRLEKARAAKPFEMRQALSSWTKLKWSAFALVAVFIDRNQEVVSEYMDKSVILCGRPEFVVVSLVFYLFVSQPLVAFFRDKVGLKPDGALKTFAFVHNVALASFSALIMIRTWPMVYSGFKREGWLGLHCSETFWEFPKGNMANATNPRLNLLPSGKIVEMASFGYWADIFYVSKYYEFVDSWLLVLQGKRPSLLQVYHHTGIVIAMYLATTARANWLVHVVCLNSFIHTLMYTYYALATMGYKSKHAQVLTGLQLAQFIVGIAASSTTYLSDKGACGKSDNRVSLVLTQVYAVGLIVLFKRFYDEKYKGTETKKPQISEAKHESKKEK